MDSQKKTRRRLKMVNNYVVAFSIDKVQVALFHVIKAHEQEKQKNKDTLSSIKRVSEEISTEFINKINEAFSMNNNNEAITRFSLLECSGVYIFTINESEENIQRISDLLFKKYYLESNGEVLINYTFFQTESSDKLFQIKKAKELLKNPTTQSDIIRNNLSLLFEFQEKELITSKRPNNMASKSFVETIDDLIPQRADKTKKSDESIQKDELTRIAIVKADLDGMGDLFAGLSDFEKYQEVSKILHETVSLKYLDQAAYMIDNCEWVYPFYVAGDDIFFAVSIVNIFKAIELCNKMAEDINQSLSDRNSNRMKLQRITMSIGIEVATTTQPIRYYLERVEKQLSLSKKEKTSSKDYNQLNDVLRSIISICNYTLYDVDVDKFKKLKADSKANRKDVALRKCVDAYNNVKVFAYFLNDLKLFITALKEEAITKHYLYTLQEKISRLKLVSDGKDKYKYFNTLAYHFLPDQFNDSNLSQKSINRHKYNMVCAHKILINSLTRNPKSNQPKFILDYSEEIRDRTINYIRLILLLTDIRFSVYLPDVRLDVIKNEEVIEATKIVVFRIQRNLYDGLTSKLRSVFIKKENVGKVSRIYKIPIEKAMFFKIRDTNKYLPDKIADMIEIKASRRRNQKNALEQDNNQENKQVFLFDRTAFLKNAKGLWTTEFVETLMLFYEYHKLEMTIKRLRQDYRWPSKNKIMDKGGCRDGKINKR